MHLLCALAVPCQNNVRLRAALQNLLDLRLAVNSTLASLRRDRAGDGAGEVGGVIDALDSDGILT